MNTYRTVTVNVKKLQAQSRQCQVTKVSDYHWTVVSNTSGNIYHIAYSPAAEMWNCNCEWGNHRGGACKHVQAVANWMDTQAGYTAAFWRTAQEAARQHRSKMVFAQGRDGKQVYKTVRKDS